MPLEPEDWQIPPSDEERRSEQWDPRSWTTNKRQRRKRNRTIRTFKTGSDRAGAGAGLVLVLVLVLVLCRRRCCCGKKIVLGRVWKVFVLPLLCGWAKGLRRLLARGCLEISAWEVKAFGCAWLGKGGGSGCGGLGGLWGLTGGCGWSAAGDGRLRGREVRTCTGGAKSTSHDLRFLRWAG